MRRTRTRQPRPSPFPANNSTFAPQSSIWRTRRSSWGTRRGAPPRSRSGSAWFKTNFGFFYLFLRVFVLIYLLWRGEVNVVLQGLGDVLLGEDANVVGVVRQEAVNSDNKFKWETRSVRFFSNFHYSPQPALLVVLRTVAKVASHHNLSRSAAVAQNGKGLF